MTRKQFELWPCHPHPLEDELLSCWLIRVAHAHQLKVQTFCEYVFGRDRQIWNRDIDRYAPRWIINRLSIQTGTPLLDAHATTLSKYRLILYRKRRDAGVLHWIMPLQMWHRKRLGFGIQFCPGCLMEDSVPYFRTRWRVALYTYCTKHNLMLHDRCPSCGNGIEFHRNELGKYELYDLRPLSYCSICEFDLRNAEQVTPEFYESSSQALMMRVLRQFESLEDVNFNEDFFCVLHQLCKLILTNVNRTKLQEYVLRQMGISGEVVNINETRYLEMLELSSRHKLVQLGLWLMVDPEIRIVNSWKAKAVRYNMLKKDLAKMPTWYREILSHCEDWREIRNESPLIN